MNQTAQLVLVLYCGCYYRWCDTDLELDLAGPWCRHPSKAINLGASLHCQHYCPTALYFPCSLFFLFFSRIKYRWLFKFSLRFFLFNYIVFMDGRGLDCSGIVSYCKMLSSYRSWEGGFSCWDKQIVIVQHVDVGQYSLSPHCRLSNINKSGYTAATAALTNRSHSHKVSFRL